VRADLGPVVTATEGATASAMKELMRRAVLRAVERDSDDLATRNAVPVIDDEVMTAVVSDFSSEAQALSRSLLGAASGDESWSRDGFSADPQGPQDEGELQGQPGPYGQPFPSRMGWSP
jgi:hypothetical protein